VAIAAYLGRSDAFDLTRVPLCALRQVLLVEEFIRLLY
jgi:hypothetical protein